MHKDSNLSTYRSVLVFLIILNILGGLYLLYDWGIVKSYNSDISFNCVNAFCALMLTAISIFYLKLLLTILNYLDLFNEQSIQVERLDTERKQLAEDLDLQRRLLIAMVSETILKSATSTLPMPELVSRGSELLRRRDYQNAIKLLTEAINADPTSIPQVYLFRAQGYFATRNRIQAKQDIEKYDELMRRSAAE